MVQKWNDLFLEIVNKHAPIKTNRVKRKHQPEWLISEILDLLKERDKCKITGKIDEYRILRNKISKMIDKAKKEMYQNKLEEGDTITLENGISCADPGIFVRGGGGRGVQVPFFFSFSPQLILQKSNGHFQRNLSFCKVPEGVQHFPGGGGVQFFQGGPIAYFL